MPIHTESERSAPWGDLPKRLADSASHDASSRLSALECTDR